MTTTEEYRNLLRRSLIVTGSCVLAVVICYFWVDRGVAFFVYNHHINSIEIFRWLTYPPPEVQNWSALVLTVLIVRRAWGPFLRWQKVLLVACVLFFPTYIVDRDLGATATSPPPAELVKAIYEPRETDYTRSGRGHESGGGRMNV